MFFLSRELRIIISPICNLNCFYCHKEGFKESMQKGEITMIDKNIKLLSKIFDFSQKIKEVTITGGEPTLFPSQLKKLIDYFRDKTENLTLITNGTNPYFLNKNANYFTEIHLHLDVLDTISRKKLMGKKSFSELKIKELIQRLIYKTNLRINSVTDDKYPIECFLKLFFWCEKKKINIGFIKPLLRESKNFEVLKKLISLMNYKKIKQKNIRKNIYKNSKGHSVEFILCNCDAYKKLSAHEAAEKCKNESLSINLSNGKLSFCFLTKKVKPNKFLDFYSRFRCPLFKRLKLKKKFKSSITEEYEIRSPIQDVQEMEKQVKKFGSFIFKERKRVCDFVYYPEKINQLSKLKKGDAVVRLRINKFLSMNNTIYTVLNIKEKINNEKWFEWETFSIKDPFYLISILNERFQPKMILDRIRTTYLDKKRGTKIEIDEFKDGLGNFIEIEGEKNIVKFLSYKLRLKKFFLAYGEIMNQKIRKHQISFTLKDFKNRAYQLLTK